MKKVIAGLFAAGVVAASIGVASARSTTVDYVWYSYSLGPQYAYDVEEVEFPCATYFGVMDWGPGACYDEAAPVGGHSTVEILD